MAKSFWDTEELLGEIEKNKSELIKVKKVTKGDKTYTDIRIFLKNEEEYRPTGKGVVIPNESINELITMLGGSKPIF
jgi:hypothetical protein